MIRTLDGHSFGGAENVASLSAASARAPHAKSGHSRLLEVDQMMEGIEQSVWVGQSKEVPSRNDLRVHADALA
jgi:hypothetical protein